MGVAVVRPWAGNNPASLCDGDGNTFVAYNVSAGMNVVRQSVEFDARADCGFPTGRKLINMRCGATIYQAKAGVSCHLAFYGNFGLADVYSGATTAYQTVYSAWAAIGSATDNQWFNNFDFVCDNRASGSITEYRIIDTWMEVQYYDYPAAPVITGGGSTTATTFSMTCNLTQPATGQTISAVFQLATDPGFSNVIQNIQTGYGGTGGYAATSVVVGPGTYYYRAYSYDAQAQGSGWSGVATVTVSYPAPGAPTAISPTSGSTVTVPNPVLGATLTAATNGQTQRAEWQLATDASFLTNLKTITEGTGDLRTSGATTESPTIANLYLTNAVWYIRARAIDVYGQYSGYSAAISFTVNVPPPPVPSVLTPAAASTVTTTNPTLGGTLGAASNGRLSRLQWQLSKDSLFATGVTTVTEPVGDNRVSGVATEPVQAAVKLNNGLWYMRALAIADDGSQSAWTATQSFTVLLPVPPTPTALTPAAGSTITTNTPTVGATLGAATDGRTSKLEFQFATDTAFTLNVKVFTQVDAQLVISGVRTDTLPIAQKLTQQTWYWRARALDQFGQYGAYSAYQTIIPVHPPNVSGQAPTADLTILYAGTTPFSWVFSDPWNLDSQRAYQIIIERNDTGAAVLDSGKVISTGFTAALAIPVGQKDFPLRWKIQVWDQDDVPSGFSNYHTFFVSDAPIITITSPTNGQAVATGKPNVTWTLDVQTVTASWRVRFYRVSDSLLVHDSGLQIGAALGYTPPNTILINLDSYRVDVQITDTIGLTSTAQRFFTTAYQAPDQVLYVVTNSFATLGYVLIDWSGMQPDNYWTEWRLYRRLVGTPNWQMLASFTSVNSRSYKDWSALAGNTYEYAVTQIADRSGVLFESAQNFTADDISTISDNYWLLNPTDDTKNFLLSNVTDDGYTDTVEQETYVVIGRGRRTDYGTDLGKSGSLTAQLRDKPWATARQQKLSLESLIRNRATYLLRTPFGDLYQVSLGEVSVSRIAGVARSEFCDIGLTYTEVF